jgi:hypothetical protein
MFVLFHVLFSRATLSCTVAEAMFYKFVREDRETKFNFLLSEASVMYMGSARLHVDLNFARCGNPLDFDDSCICFYLHCINLIN